MDIDTAEEVLEFVKSSTLRATRIWQKKNANKKK